MSDDTEKTQTETNNTSQGKTGSEQKSKTQKIEVSVNTGNIEDLIKRLKETEDKSTKLTEQLEKEMEEKKKVKKTLEEKTAEAEDYEGKLKLIAEEKLNAKRQVIMELAKKYIKDEERLKKIEEKMITPENVQATEFMIETLAKAFTEGAAAHKELTDEEQKKAEEEAKKAAEEAKKAAENANKTDEEKKAEAEAKKAAEKAADPVDKGKGAGQATLAQQSGTTTKREYDSNEAMIRDLRKRSRDSDPEVAAEAQAILDELFYRWGKAIIKDYDGRYKSMRITKKDQPLITDMAKEGGAAKPNPKKRIKLEDD